MQQALLTTGMLAGGLGLFLLAVGMITDGLKLAAGNTLRDMLGKWTNTPFRGIMSGITITAIVQSSSAVTLATIGFVNAGLLSMRQALGVVFGSNIGTTVTGWLVAIIGFKLNIDAFALPLVGLGMIMRLTGGMGRLGGLGTALAGFGLFFIGIDVLKDAFESFVLIIDLQSFTSEGISGVLLFLGIGFLMTLLTQSSSAAIAITLTAATGGVVGIYAAAAMVIGANVGTTSTAIFSVIGATPNAKRVAAAHVLFNLLTGAVALLIMPVMFALVGFIEGLLELEQVPVITLALFHTTFNILGVLLMWPFSARLAEFLEGRFKSLEEITGRPQHLDRNVAVSPALALNAAVLESCHLYEVVSRLSVAVLTHPNRSQKQTQSDREAAEQLVTAIGDFIMHMERSTMPKDIATELPKVLRTNQYYFIAAELAVEIGAQFSSTGKLSNTKLIESLAEFRTEVVNLLQTTDVRIADFEIEECELALEKLKLNYQSLKELILETGAESGITVREMSVLLEQYSNIRRLTVQTVKATRYLSALFVYTSLPKQPEQEEKEEEKEEEKDVIPLISAQP